MLYGGISGQLSWIAVYPFDVIKTQIQKETTRKLSVSEVTKAIYSVDGTRGFFKGLSPTVARTFMINSVRLPFFEYFNQIFCNKFIVKLREAQIT